MLDAITTQLSPAHRNFADRSIAATSGALFGLVFAGTVAMLTGRAPFVVDLPMMTLYASVIPLSVAAFMMHFSREKPELPMLATLQFLAIFVPAMFFGEVLAWGRELHIAGLEFGSSSFVGFRAIVVATMSGFFFSAIKANETVGEATRDLKPNVDWQQRHDEAVRRLAMVDVELRRERTSEQAALEAFDRQLQSLTDGEVVELDIEETDWTLEVDEDISTPALAAS